MGVLKLGRGQFCCKAPEVSQMVRAPIWGNAYVESPRLNYSPQESVYAQRPPPVLPFDEFPNVPPFCVPQCRCPLLTLLTPISKEGFPLMHCAGRVSSFVDCSTSASPRPPQFQFDHQASSAENCLRSVFCSVLWALLVSGGPLQG
jgi:hypothetical protein